MGVGLIVRTQRHSFVRIYPTNRPQRLFNRLSQRA